MKTHGSGEPKKQRTEVKIPLGDELRKIHYGPTDSKLPLIKQIEEFLKEELPTMIDVVYLSTAARMLPAVIFERKLWGQPAKYGNVSPDQHLAYEQFMTEVQNLRLYKRLVRFCTKEKLELRLRIDISYTKIVIDISWPK